MGDWCVQLENETDVFLQAQIPCGPAHDVLNIKDGIKRSPASIKRAACHFFGAQWHSSQVEEVTLHGPALPLTLSCVSGGLTLDRRPPMRSPYRDSRRG